MKILVACEESQRVCISFRDKGHEAYSCDLQPCSGGFPEWHIQDDVTKYLYDKCWDLIIAFPPCTRLCNSGQRWLYFGSPEYQEKKRLEQQEGINFFRLFTELPCNKVAIENPAGIMSTLYKKPSQVINPWQFGEPENKRTCLWLKNLPLLQPTNIIPKEQRKNSIWKANFDGKSLAFNDPLCAKMRSKTFWGVARAMAEQWG